MYFFYNDLNQFVEFLLLNIFQRGVTFWPKIFAVCGSDIGRDLVGAPIIIVSKEVPKGWDAEQHLDLYIVFNAVPSWTQSMPEGISPLLDVIVRKTYVRYNESLFPLLPYSPLLLSPIFFCCETVKQAHTDKSLGSNVFNFIQFDHWTK